MSSDPSSGPSPEGFSSAMSYLNFAEGKSITQLAKQSVGAYIATVGAAVGTSTQWLFNLLVIVPAEVMTDIVDAAGEAFFEDPLTVISSGATDTGDAVGEFGILALPVAAAVVLGTYYMYIRYLREEETSNLIPGMVSDIPLVGTDEEAEADD
jgi:hypothetical protein